MANATPSSATLSLVDPPRRPGARRVPPDDGTRRSATAEPPTIRSSVRQICPRLTSGSSTRSNPSTSYGARAGSNPVSRPELGGASSSSSSSSSSSPPGYEPARDPHVAHGSPHIPSSVSPIARTRARSPSRASRRSSPRPSVASNTERHQGLESPRRLGSPRSRWRPARPLEAPPSGVREARVAGGSEGSGRSCWRRRREEEWSSTAKNTTVGETTVGSAASMSRTARVRCRASRPSPAPTSSMTSGEVPARSSRLCAGGTRRALGRALGPTPRTAGGRATGPRARRRGTTFPSRAPGARARHAPAGVHLGAHGASSSRGAGCSASRPKRRPNARSTAAPGGSSSAASSRVAEPSRGASARSRRNVSRRATSRKREDPSGRDPRASRSAARRGCRDETARGASGETTSESSESSSMTTQTSSIVRLTERWP